MASDFIQETFPLLKKKKLKRSLWRAATLSHGARCGNRLVASDFILHSGWKRDTKRVPASEDVGAALGCRRLLLVSVGRLLTNAMCMNSQECCLFFRAEKCSIFGCDSFFFFFVFLGKKGF